MADNDPARPATQPGGAAATVAPGATPAALASAAAPVAATPSPEPPPSGAAAPAGIPAGAASDGAAADGTAGAPAAAVPPAEPPAEPAAAAPAEELKAEPSLLETVTKKPEEPAPAATEAAPVVPEAPPQAYDLKLPEGIAAAPEQMTAYTTVLGENKIAPEVGQKLLDLHAAALQAYAEQAVAEQWRAFADTRRDWRNAIMADERLGGAGFETTKIAVARARNLLVAPSDEAAFNEFLSTTGAGDHLQFWRMLANAAERLSEPAVPQPAMKPPADIGKAPKGADRATIYDHPRSRHSA